MSEIKANVYDLMDTKHGRELIKESIAEIFHDAWTDWSQSVTKEGLTKARLIRWETFWNTPYCQIPEKEKEPEFELAERVMRRLGLNLTDKEKDSEQK